MATNIISIATLALTISTSAFAASETPTGLSGTTDAVSSFGVSAEFDALVDEAKLNEGSELLITTDADEDEAKNRRNRNRRRGQRGQRGQRGENQRGEGQQAQQQQGQQGPQGGPEANNNGERPRGENHARQVRNQQRRADHQRRTDRQTRAQTIRENRAQQRNVTRHHVRPTHTTHARPHAAHHNHHTRPARWHHHWRHGHRVHWYHGVFVYGPNPWHHGRVRSGHYSGTNVAPLPSRSIDRNNVFSIGVKGGSFASGYDLGGEFSDFGLGVNARFRPVEGLGFEISYSHHDDTFDGETERVTTVLSPSVQVFAAPWTRFSPYASLGVTWVDRDYSDTWSDGFDMHHTTSTDSSFGPHVGAGIEVALGQHAAIDFEARAIGFLDAQEDGTIPGAVQGTVGANWYF